MIQNESIIIYKTSKSYISKESNKALTAFDSFELECGILKILQ